MNGILQDLRYALRQLRKNPGFTAVAVVTLALGIGANTAVFSVMNAVLLRSLPVHDPQRLYYLKIGGGDHPPRATTTGNDNISFSEPVFEALRQRQDIFEDLVAYAPLSVRKVAVRYGEAPEEAEGDEVSGNFFSGLSAGIARGRGLTPNDEQTHAAVAVISYDYWTRRFARNSSTVGETLFVKGVAFTIVGIAAPGFRGIEEGSSTDFWVPLQTRAELNAWGESPEQYSLYGSPRWWFLQLIGRLRRDVSPAQAQSALQSTFGEAAKIGVGDIDPKEWKPLLDFDLAKGIEGYNQDYRDPVRMLMGLAALVLLIACTNVALLLVARNEARQREFSLKMAIGADKARVFRQLLTESSLLVTAGSAIGWGFAIFATRALADWAEIESGLDPDRNVLLFTLGTSVLVAIGFGLAPLWNAVRLPISGVLRATSTGLTQARRRALGGRILMSSQLAICLLLLMAAGLLLRTLRNYETQDLGMRTEGLLVFGVTPLHARTSQETVAFYHTLLDRVRVLPGVEAATFMQNRLGAGWGSNNNNEVLDGIHLQQKFGSKGTVRSNKVGPDYFSVLGVPIFQGRDISDADTETSAPVAIVNETFVKRFLPSTNPLGHKLSGRTIVGVVKDSKYENAFELPIPTAYYPGFQTFKAGVTVHVEIKCFGEALSLLPTVGKAIHEIDPNIPLERPMTQQAQFEESYSDHKMFARLGGFFGGLAALLVATGLYGTLSYRTNRRTSEIGMRMAFGAQRGQVLWMVMRDSLVVCAMGLGFGLPLTFLGAGLMGSMLYKVSPLDLVSLCLAMSCVALVAVAASFLPARRAAKVDPMVALRYE